jgi:hypothetical protein
MQISRFILIALSWSLIMPPLKHRDHTWSVDRSAPLEWWQLVGRYGSSDDCETEKRRLYMSTRDPADAARVHESVCIATEALRLKNK